MIEEIPLKKIRECAQYFPDPQLEIILDSIAEGNTRAALWRSIQPQNDITLLLWDKGNNVFYLSGDLILEEAIKEMAALIMTHIKDIAIQEDLSHFNIHTLSPPLEKALPQLFQDAELYKMNKFFYGFQQPNLLSTSAELANLQYKLIDTDFLAQDHYQNIQYVQSEIDWMWPSRKKFCENGFGYAALLGESIVCWCTAEYVSTKKCGIGIETLQTYQNQGIATATAVHFVNYCLSHNIIPYWECDSQNIGSIRVAEKVGFERIQETMVWGGEFVS